MERRPVQRLRPWVDKLWALSDAPRHSRERILPSGTLELVINLHEDEFRIYGADAAAPHQRFRGALVSGAYDRFFGIDTREHASIVGVHFAPAGASAVLGVPAGELRNAHVELDALWGAEASALRERLWLAESVEQRFSELESALCRRLDPSPRHRAVGPALAWLERGAPVAHVAARASLSHRRFIEVFVAAVGMTPKAFARACRFQRVVARLVGEPTPDWAALATLEGYCDQSHLIREFLELAGLAPSLFASSSRVPVKEHHVALPESG